MLFPVHYIVFSRQVQKNIEKSHGDGGNKFADSKRNHIVFEPGCTQCNRTGNKMKRIAKSENNGHNAEQQILFISFGLCDHQDSQRDDGG